MYSLLVLAWLAAADLGSPLQIGATGDPARPEVIARQVASNLPDGAITQEQGEKVLRLALVDEATGKEGPAIWGMYGRRGADLVFRPRHPLIAGQRYRAQLLGPMPASSDYAVPRRAAGEPVVVKEFFPALDVLPANNLRFTIVFSRPMRGGKEIFDQIRLVDDNGKEVEDPWLHDELWDADGCRLILYIHPGRIKWGVLLRDLFGPALLPNRDYSLVLSPDLLDATGQRLGKEYRKKFRTKTEDRNRIELKDWKLWPPSAGTSEALVLEFPKAIDHFSLRTFLTVHDAAGKRVEGSIRLGENQKSWRFVPAVAWKAGEYRVSVDERLEDLAGNSPVRAFDFDNESEPPPAQSLSLEFRPKEK